MPSKRLRTYRETSDLVSGARRMVRAIGRRAPDEDATLIYDLRELRGLVDAVMRDAVRGQRARGVTWQEIGDAVGTTRQAALMRWGDK